MLLSFSSNSRRLTYSTNCLGLFTFHPSFLCFLTEVSPRRDAPSQKPRHPSRVLTGSLSPHTGHKASAADTTVRTTMVYWKMVLGNVTSFYYFLTATMGAIIIGSSYSHFIKDPEIKSFASGHQASARFKHECVCLQSVLSTLP